MEQLLAMLRAAGDATRLRLLLVLRDAELTVSELTQVLGQSQPRVSRHLKLLCDAGLLQRFKEGSWVFYRAADRGAGAEFASALLALAEAAGVPDEGDTRRLAAVREARARQAADFFKANAAQWERIRSLHAPDKDVEDAIVRLLQGAPIAALLDAGTGTGRMLELLAPYIKRGIGVDVSPEMLAIARDRLERAKIHHCQVRLGDIYRLPFSADLPAEGMDVVLVHQVLHYLDDPQAAVVDAARVLRPGGRILIADFAPHALEFLRDELAHRRLGFTDREVEGWFKAAGLTSAGSEAIAPGRREAQAGDGKLTVKIWVAVKTVAPASLRASKAA
ncbi:MAG: metalloregulator ArsR/SmtB family transcription factor [Pseudomonadota bacterium]|nr:metalloregulator ArsR/SmtB family transcription factor [Pseudomonadota bacterium]